MSRAAAPVPLLVLVTLTIGCWTVASAQDDHAGGRLGCRFATEVPPGAVFDELDEVHPRVAFSPLVDEIVEAMSEESFTTWLRALSGEDEITVDGLPLTLETRYSPSSQGYSSRAWAYEQLVAMGYTVSFHEYTRSGYTLENVVATLPGTLTPWRIYVLGGHIDSISEQPSTLAPGAEDNGSGSAAILSAAAALAEYAFESTIEIVLFSGEEQGLWGSTAYVADALAAGRDLRAAVTFDMIAYYNDNYGVLIEGEPAWSDLMSAMADAVDAYTTLERQFSYYSFGSDHVPFQDRGVPAILCIDLDWDEYAAYHRSWDRFSETTPDLGTQIARAGTATIAQLARPVGAAVDVPDSVEPGPMLAVGPNPATLYASIAFSGLAEGERIGIFDAAGRLVRHLPPAARERRRVVWDLLTDAGSRVSSGIYWVRAGSLSRRLVVL